MEILKNSIEQFLENKNWKFDYQEEAFVFAMEIETYQFFCSFHLLEKERIIVFYSHFPHKIQKKHLKSIAWLITELNFSFSIGNFELDIHTGRLRYKTSIDVEGLDNFLPLIDNLTNANFSIFVETYPQIEKKLQKII